MNPLRTMPRVVLSEWITVVSKKPDAIVGPRGPAGPPGTPGKPGKTGDKGGMSLFGK